MKANKPNDDAAFDVLLREWKIEPSLPPRFGEWVWRRIERAATPPAPSVSLAAVLAHWIASLPPRPALAAAYVTVLLAIGAGAGWHQARLETARVSNDLKARYVQAVDPYQPIP